VPRIVSAKDEPTTSSMPTSVSRSLPLVAVPAARSIVNPALRQLSSSHVARSS
jgi:hypothetical protein